MPEQLKGGELLKKQPVIVIDIDGVIFDTPQQAIERWNGIFGTVYVTPDIFDHNATHDKKLFRHYHEEGRYKDEKGKFDDGFYDAQKDVLNYLLLPGVKDVLWRLKNKYDARIIALTARNPHALKDVTIQGLKDHVGLGESEEDLVDELYFSGDPDHGQHREKGDILRDLGADVMVEDSIRNATSSEKFGIPAIIINQPYNTAETSWPAEKRGANWEDLFTIIGSTLENRGFKGSN